tara:strand:- start:1016 stop:1453 length:438 start_codon:yes stop_codon:yes gene_type:complete
MNKYTTFLKTLKEANLENIDVPTMGKDVEGYSSEMYDEIERFEDEMAENSDLYDILEHINLVLKKPCYTPIQSMNPKMDVNNNSIYICGYTKDNCPENEELLKQYVKDLQASTNSPLKFKAVIDECELDGLKKFQLELTCTRKGK